MLSPTADVATGVSMPSFWRNRRLSAIPPRPAGASFDAYEEPTSAANVGPAGNRLGTLPSMLTAAPT